MRTPHIVPRLCCIALTVLCTLLAHINNTSTNVYAQTSLGTTTPQQISTASNDDSYIDAPPVPPSPEVNIGPKSIKNSIAPTGMRAGADTIILVHGFHGQQSNGSSRGVDCNAYWGDVKTYINQYHDINGQSLKWKRTFDIQTIGFYSGDINCNANLHDSRYTEKCRNYVPGNEGTNNESLYHISCLFAWYLYLNYGKTAGWNVEIVAHSMGGLIVRNTLYQVEKKKAPTVFPSTLGGISDVVDFSTPHKGLTGYPSYFVCGDCHQYKDMTYSGQFMSEMRAQAQNPQGERGTDWTLIGSNCDGYVDMYSATYMAADHPEAFVNNNQNGTCYDHSNILHDMNDSYNAAYYYCLSCLTPPDPGGPPIFSWNYWNQAPRSLHEMMHALWLYW